MAEPKVRRLEETSNQSAGTPILDATDPALLLQMCVLEPFTALPYHGRCTNHALTTQACALYMP